jgi:hypothetical protein
MKGRGRVSRSPGLAMLQLQLLPLVLSQPPMRRLGCRRLRQVCSQVNAAAAHAAAQMHSGSASRPVPPPRLLR